MQERVSTLQEQVRQLVGERPVTIVAVSKYATVEQIRQAYATGLRHFGESRIQDALAKMEALPDSDYPGIQWHFIGTLQTNKVTKTVNRFSLVHSLDSMRLAQALSQANRSAGIRQPVLLQINSTPLGVRRGFQPEEVQAALPELLQLPGLKVNGLMTMAPPDVSLNNDEMALNQTFESLRLLRDQLSLSCRQTLQMFSSAENISKSSVECAFSELSMGMSRDFPFALANGATIIRVGNYLFQTGENATVGI